MGRKKRENRVPSLSLFGFPFFRYFDFVATSQNAMETTWWNRQLETDWIELAVVSIKNP
jgi:hypothetical protein